MYIALLKRLMIIAYKLRLEERYASSSSALLAEIVTMTKQRLQKTSKSLSYFNNQCFVRMTLLRLVLTRKISSLFFAPWDYARNGIDIERIQISYTKA